MNLYNQLPAFRNERKNIVDDHSTKDIINEVCKAHYVYAADYDRIAGDFERGDIQSICAALFSWCKRSLKYKEESEGLQTTRSPAAIIKMSQTWGVDCKHYAGFIAGVLDALKRKGYSVDWCYRFVSYDLFDQTPGHVFVVVKDGNREIYVDPVLSILDQRFPVYYYKQDKFCNMIQRISGIGVSRYDTAGGVIVPVPDARPIVVRPSTGTPVVPSTGTPAPSSPDADQPTGGGGGGSVESGGNTWLWIAVAAAAGYYFYKKSKRRR